MTSLEIARNNMIEQQIRPWDVLDTGVLDLLKRVKREAFVPSAYAGLAFSDTQLPLGHGQMMLTPKLEARLLQTAQVKAGDRVLHIGTGSGYLAALLGYTAAQVLSFETHASLAASAQTSLHKALMDNVVVHTGCGFLGGVAHAQARGWDLIVLSGSAPSVAAIPQALLNTMTIGARLVGVFGDAAISPMMQVFCIIRRNENHFETQGMFDCDAPALTGIASPSFKL